MLLLELSLVNGFEELTVSKLLSFKNLVRIGDEIRDFDFNFRSVNVKRLPLLVPTSIVLFLTVNVVELFVDKGLGKIIGRDDLANGVVLKKLHLLRATDATSKWKDSTLSWV